MNSLRRFDIFQTQTKNHPQHLYPAQRYTSFPAHTDRVFVGQENGSIACSKAQKNNLEGLELEIKSDIGNIVQGALAQVEPNKLVGGRILISNSADVSTGGNL